jgi:hypothetical protein
LPVETAECRVPIVGSIAEAKPAVVEPCEGGTVVEVHVKFLLIRRSVRAGIRRVPVEPTRGHGNAFEPEFGKIV